jgi:uncharacterized protein (TIGR00251 family)
MSSAAGVRLEIRVTPRASRTSVELRDGRVLVRVTAPPVDSAANEAVREALAEALDVPRRAVQIIRGQTGRQKIVEIAGIDAAELQRRIAGVKKTPR